MTSTLPVTPSADVTAVRAASSRSRLREGLLDAAGVTALTASLLAVVLRLYEASFKVPFSYPGPWSQEFFAGDATFHLMVARALEQGRWWSAPNPSLGAPLGQDLRDFPLGPDHLHVVLLKGLVELLGDPFAAVNAYYLLGYPLVALSAWAALRLIGISRPVAVVVALLFAFLPYHGGKGPEHLFLANYATVPLAGLLLHWHLTGRTAWGPARRGAAIALTARRLVAVLAIAVLLGSSSAYYALYFLVLLALTTVIQVLVQRDWRPALSAVLLGLPVAVMAVLNALPAVLHAAAHGPNAVLARTPYQSSFFGLRPSQLLMPVEGHRLGPLDDLSRAQQVNSVWQEPGNNLGLLAAATLLALALVLLQRLARGTRVDGPRARLRERHAGLSLLAVLVATSGGGSLLIALLGVGQARVWARMSIFIAFFVLCALATWLDDALDWWRRRSPARWAWAPWPALTAVLLFGVWDQTSPDDVPTYQPVQVAFDSDYAFMREARDVLGDGALVWQLPQVPFPEGGLRTADMYDYDHFKGYLHAPELRWSYGAVKGRQAASWQQTVVDRALPEHVKLVAAAGFSAIYVDTFAPDEQGRDLLPALQALVEQEPITSSDGRLVLFDLRPFAQRLQAEVGQPAMDAAAADLLEPSYEVDFRSGFSPRGEEDLNSRWAPGQQAELSIENPSAAPVDVRLTLSTRTVERDATMRISGPGFDRTVEIVNGGAAVDVSFTLPPAGAVLGLSTDSRTMAFRTGDRTFSVGSPLVLGPQAQQVVRACASTTAKPGQTC